jgi:hypothetical protein
MEANSFRLASVGLLACVPLLAQARQSGQLTPEEQQMRAVVAPLLMNGEVCDAALVGGSLDQTPTILASIDYSGRRFCNTVFLVRGGRTPAIIQELLVWNTPDLHGALRDIDNDGRDELVVLQALSSYEGARCIAAVPIVYTCSARSCVNTGTEHLGFFQQKLAEVESELASAPPLEQDDREEASCLTMERDKLRRLLGVDSNAGRETAAKWLQSDNPRLRSKAVKTLADIGDRDSRERLEKAAKEADKDTAMEARQALERMRR